MNKIETDELGRPSIGIQEKLEQIEEEEGLDYMEAINESENQDIDIKEVFTGPVKQEDTIERYETSKEEQRLAIKKELKLFADLIYKEVDISKHQYFQILNLIQK